MSGYGPFSWSYGLSVLKTIAEPTWHYDREVTATNSLNWNARDPNQHLKPRLPVATYIGWALLRIALCIDIALINELVGYFVLAAVRYKAYSFNTHRDPYAVAFIGAIGGRCSFFNLLLFTTTAGMLTTCAVSTVLVFIIDIIYSRPERRERWPMIDPNSTISATIARANPNNSDDQKHHLDDLAAKLALGLDTTRLPPHPPQVVPADVLTMQGNPKDAKNMTEGGPITLTKLRTHALVRIVIWAAAACVAGAAGTAIWFAKDGTKTVNRMEDRVITGIIVQLVGVSVIVVGPSILQLLSLLFESAETKVVQQRRPRAVRTT